MFVPFVSSAASWRVRLFSPRARTNPLKDGPSSSTDETPSKIGDIFVPRESGLLKAKCTVADEQSFSALTRIHSAFVSLRSNHLDSFAATVTCCNGVHIPFPF